MKTVFRLTTLFYAILLCTPSFAQKKTVTGFYISVQGDTVKGVFPNYSQWSNNPSEVEFAAAASVEPTTLTPQNCRNFVIEGHDEYLSYAGQRLVNPIYDNEVSKKRYSNLGDEQEEVVTFLRLVTRTPNCELYVFTDNKRPNFFYRLPGDSVVELKYKKYYFENQLDVSGFMRGYIAEITDYKGQLNSLFAEAIYRRKLTSALNTLPYAEDRLKMFLEQLFSTEPVKHKKKNPAAGWIVSAGASLNFVHVKADRSFNLVAKEYNSSISPLLSIGYIAPLSRNFGKYFLYPQLNLFRYKNTGEINDGTFKRVTTYQSDLVISGEVNGGFNIVNQQGIRFYLAGGAGMLALLNNKRLDFKYLNIQPSSEPYSSSQTSIAFKNHPFFNASAGMIIKNNLLVAAAYLFPTSIDNVIRYEPQYSGLQLRIGYKVK